MTSNQNRHDDDTPWEALARYAAGESSDAERQRVGRWLDAHPAERRLVTVLRDGAAQGDGLDLAAVEAALRQVRDSV